MRPLREEKNRKERGKGGWGGNEGEREGKKKETTRSEFSRQILNNKNRIISDSGK